MSVVMEAIDRMSSDERVKTMEYLWAAMTAAAEPESPAWHGDRMDGMPRRPSQSLRAAVAPCAPWAS